MKIKYFLVDISCLHFITGILDCADKQDKMLVVQGKMLDVQHQMLDMQGQILYSQHDLLDEVRESRRDLKSYLEQRFEKLEGEVAEMRIALKAKGII